MDRVRMVSIESCSTSVLGTCSSVVASPATITANRRMRRRRGSRPGARRAPHRPARTEITLHLERFVAGEVAEEADAVAEDLAEEGRDGVVPRLLVAGEDLPELRPVVGRGRPVLDPPVAAVERVVELRDVADRVDTGARALEPFVDDDAAPDLEPGLTRELEVQLDADPRHLHVGLGSVR